MTSNVNPAQREFNERYITSVEITHKLRVSRTAILLARRAGRLPDPIDLHGRIFLWERDKVQPYIDAWKIVLDTRRRAAA